MSDGLVLHVNAETTWRGGENQVYQLATGMHRERSCAVACVRGSPLAERLMAAGIPIHAIPGDRGIRSVFALRRLIRDLRPAILHGHTSRAHQLCLLAGTGMKLPLVVTRRVDFPIKRGPIAGWKYRNKKVHFVAISQAICDILVAGGVSRHQVRIIPSGVDFAALDAAAPVDIRGELKLEGQSRLVLNVAALSDHKDHATLLRAWVMVEARHPEVHLLIAGEGELREVLLKQVKESGIRRVHFLGHRSDVPGLMKGSDLFVMSSHLEGLCTSIMDAKRCGLPVVATRAGGIPEVVKEGDGGTLVDVRDASGLAAAINAYLSDEPLRRRTAVRAREDSERFAAVNMVKAYLTLYDRLASVR